VPRGDMHDFRAFYLALLIEQQFNHERSQTLALHWVVFAPGGRLIITYPRTYYLRMPFPYWPLRRRLV